ncbi:hypothetical protein QO058_30210 (plasmid) [Bosea vestrisii]|uniref:hypothetical protein n=1 Tax=Bosea vestrisii TaxID=151416 RepID=UPI0024DFE2C5|nr:hypothetical protein [Bosea vestrisii]WID99677.1 hypothetical protein QO058_30210 [Bosea vestrisii]
MTVLGELLFYRRDQVDLDAILRHHAELLRQHVDKLSDKLFSEKSDDEIAELVAKEATIKPLEVDFAAAKPSVEETQVEVHDRYGFNRGPTRVPGLKATKAIPFKGDPDLWRLRTNPFNMNPPRGDIRGGNLIVGITVPAQQANEAAKYIEDTINQIPEYLARQAAQIEPHNAGLAGQAMQWVKARRQRLGSAADLLKKLGG